MQLWQMDVMGGVHLGDGSEVKVVTGIDDHSRFVVCAQVVRRATAGPVCDALAAALRRHGVPEQILTDNGKVFTAKVFTARFGLGPGPVRFDRICTENGIGHLLTAPYSPTTTGKVERLHKTMRAEFFRRHEREYVTIAELQAAALDGWIVHYNTERPHQSLGMCPPADRFRLAQNIVAAAIHDAAVDAVDPLPSPAVEPHRPSGVSRWVDQAGQVSVAGFRCRVGRPFAGEPVEVVVAGGLVEVLHSGVLVATHVAPTGRSSACTPPGTTRPKNTAPSPPRTAAPANQNPHPKPIMSPTYRTASVARVPELDTLGQPVRRGAWPK
jgi:Integrase core domain